LRFLTSSSSSCYLETCPSPRVLQSLNGFRLYIRGAEDSFTIRRYLLLSEDNTQQSGLPKEFVHRRSRFNKTCSNGRRTPSQDVRHKTLRTKETIHRKPMLLISQILCPEKRSDVRPSELKRSGRACHRTDPNKNSWIHLSKNIVRDLPLSRKISGKNGTNVRIPPRSCTSGPPTLN